MIKAEDITYNGITYPVREIRLAEYEVDVRISTVSLRNALFDADGEYTSRDAGLLDELLFFYVPDDMIHGANEDLEQYINDNLEWY